MNSMKKRKAVKATIWDLFRDGVIAECREWLIKKVDEPTLAHDMYAHMAKTPAPHKNCYDCKKFPITLKAARRG